MTRRVEVAPDPAELARRAADLFVRSCEEAISVGHEFRVALSGGTTPKRTFETLASPPYRDQVAWDRVQMFFSDERFVPLHSPESNYYLANETLFSRVPIPERFVHRYATVDIPPDQSASTYEEGIRRVFHAGLDVVPAFDLIYLGLGDDGHTASLFPGTEALHITDRLVAANYVPAKDMWRLTFTYPLLNAPRRVAFLAEGENKAEMVSRVLDGDSALPAAGVQPSNGELIWMLDEAAASELP